MFLNKIKESIQFTYSTFLSHFKCTVPHHNAKNFLVQFFLL